MRDGFGAVLATLGFRADEEAAVLLVPAAGFRADWVLLRAPELLPAGFLLCVIMMLLIGEQHVSGSEAAS